MKHAIWTICGVLLLLTAARARAESATQVFERVAPSVVVVLSLDPAGKRVALGSGVAIAPGVVATNCHVIRDGASCMVRYHGQDYPARLLNSDWRRDVCSLEVPGLPAPPVMLGDTASLKVGVTVYAVGAPKGLELTLSQGIVSSLRDLEDGRFIQTTAAISHGSSGGGLFDDQGRLLGLTSFYVGGGQQLNFALPVEWIGTLPQRSVRLPAQGLSEAEWITRSLALEAKEDWHGFLTVSQAWVKAQPDCAIAWGALGAAYVGTHQYAQAIEAYRQALKINPQLAVAWAFLGQTYERAGRYAEAIEAYHRALKVAPEIAETWYRLGLAYGRISQYDQAIEAFRQALTINPQYAEAWCGLGAAYSDSDRDAQAIEPYRQALKINPQYAVAWYALGVAYRSIGQYAQAIEAYRRALKINPQDAEVWSGLGIAYGAAGQHADAIEACRQALKINPQDPKAWLSLGLAYKLAGERDRVIEVYQELKTLSPDLADKLFNLAIAPR
ncbi:tetratricopeptide repeat protein [Methylacidimicrobium tartarophylax]|uniref:Serine protease HtrA n=1 Tax=Methylacidimicrobium tartarophylax TaxID=1041768 RepID=A0A5E6MDP2_9BACT|nr:tetratricopeptide repeat protein [Methylacidimicrobium tartarophylax]VVM07092.1 Putative serine protease HtrA [Methylacidimicrobium tartarophylax]